MLRLSDTEKIINCICQAEARWVKNLIDDEDLHYIWTGGRKCNFKGDNSFCSTIATINFTFECFKHKQKIEKKLIYSLT